MKLATIELTTRRGVVAPPEIFLNNAIAEYPSRLQARMSEARACARRSVWLSGLRFVVFLLIVIAAVYAVILIGDGRVSEATAALVALPPAALFIYLIALHERTIRARQRADRGAAYYARGLERLEDNWAGKGKTGVEFLNASHPYARDLDLFGRGSLFELISAARTRSGEKTLAAWLLDHAEPDEVRRRQAAVEELRGRLDLREDLAVLGHDVRQGTDPEEIKRWAAAPARLIGIGPRIAAGILAALGIFAVAAWAFMGWGPGLFAAIIVVDLIFARWFRGRVVEAHERASRLASDLALLADLLQRLESEHFQSNKLAELRRSFETDGLPASRQISRLRSLIDWLDNARSNQVFAPIAFILMLPLQLAFAVERWRVRVGSRLPAWIEAIGEIEALASFAGYAYEHPNDTFPEISGDSMLFEAEALGHPLIPESRCVRNDVQFGEKPRLILMSGSNMSGKSTFLRTVGINAVLALAGAPVRARRLRLSPLAVGASIQNTDSLQEGTSRFFAEISRIKQVASMGEGRLPVLFLVDEILSGTNPQDRRIGAEAVVRQFLSRNAFGIITTHDLEFTKIASRLDGAAENFHFEDRLVEGKIVFDYKLKPGVVKQGNALDLMRAVGLDV
jgi:hypothetical protein